MLLISLCYFEYVASVFLFSHFVNVAAHITMLFRTCFIILLFRVCCFRVYIYSVMCHVFCFISHHFFVNLNMLVYIFFYYCLTYLLSRVSCFVSQHYSVLSKILVLYHIFLLFIFYVALYHDINLFIPLSLFFISLCFPISQHYFVIPKRLFFIFSLFPFFFYFHFSLFITPSTPT